MLVKLFEMSRSITCLLGLMLLQVLVAYTSNSIDINIYLFVSCTFFAFIILRENLKLSGWGYVCGILLVSLPLGETFLTTICWREYFDKDLVFMVKSLSILGLMLLVNCVYFLDDTHYGFESLRNGEYKQLTNSIGFKWPWQRFFIFKATPYSVSGRIHCLTKPYVFDFSYVFQATLDPKKIADLYPKFKNHSIEWYLKDEIERVMLKEIRGYSVDEFDKDLTKLNRLSQSFLEAFQHEPDFKLFNQLFLSVKDVKFC